MSIITAYAGPFELLGADVPGLSQWIGRRLIWSDWCPILPASRVFPE